MTESTVGSPTTAAICSPRRSCLGEIYRNEASVLGVVKSCRVHVADHDHGRTQEQRRGGRCEADRTGSGDVNRRTWLHARIQGAVEPGRQDVSQHRQISDLRHCLGLVREFEQVEVGIGGVDVAGLAADPAAHVNIAVGTSRATGIDRWAHPGIRLPAGRGTVHKQR